MSKAHTIQPEPVGTGRGDQLFQSAEDNLHRRTDRLFARLLIFQWVAGVMAAFWITPKTWIGTTSQTHWHVWAAIFLGGLITSLPVYLAKTNPGRPLTRHIIAAAQMFYSALLIHLTGGRIETHFHVFGSLAFLAFYRDWRVLLTATIVVATDHFLRGTFWPQSVFGILATSPWRWMEHAGWVVFEDVFLLISIRQSRLEMFSLAERQATLEAINADIERKVAERTEDLQQEVDERYKAEAALRESQGLYHSLVEQLPIHVYRMDEDGRYVFVNSRFSRLTGRMPGELLGKHLTEIASNPAEAEKHQAHHDTIMRTRETIQVEETVRPVDAVVEYHQVVKLPVLRADGRIIGTQGIHFDITQRKMAEEKLTEMHQQLVLASRQAGMAEVATSVLHNVGNVLHSVNVSSLLITEKIRTSKVSGLGRAAAMLQSNQADLARFLSEDPKGRQLPGYLCSLADFLAREQAEVLQEATSLAANIQHIKEVVAMQQSFARQGGVLEPLNLTELMEGAIRLNSLETGRRAVMVERDYGAVPRLILDRHKILQILINLIRNARHACEDSGRADRKITLRVGLVENRVRLVVADNGVGIPPENLTRIFAHGFTTRKNGHGFGLHSGALAAKEMGGSLLAASAGAGCGAAFTLELPVHLPNQS